MLEINVSDEEKVEKLAPSSPFEEKDEELKPIFEMDQTIVDKQKDEQTYTLEKL